MNAEAITVQALTDAEPDGQVVEWGPVVQDRRHFQVHCDNDHCEQDTSNLQARVDQFITPSGCLTVRMPCNRLTLASSKMRTACGPLPSHRCIRCYAMTACDALHRA